MSEEINSRISKITIDEVVYDLRDKITEDKVVQLEESFGKRLDDNDNLIKRLLDATFPIVLTFTANPSTNNEREVEKPIKFSWKATIDGKEIDYNSAIIELSVVGGTTKYRIEGADLTNKYKTLELKTTTTVEIEVTAEGLVKTAQATEYFYYPIYYGMGTSAENVKNSGEKIVSSTAKRTYAANTAAGSSNQYFFILVPTGVTSPTKFSMGGAPFVMEKSTETIGGISYTVFRSGEIYGNGAGVNVEAS